MTNQASTSEKKPNFAQAPPVSFLGEEKKLADRLREAMGDQSGTAFARRCGISEGAIRKYLLGASPSTENLIAMADAANVSIEWLAAGRGPKQRGSTTLVGMTAVPAEPKPFDTERLARAIGAVQEGLASIRRTLPPDKHAQLIEAAYELILADECHFADPNKRTADQISKFIKLVA